MNIVLFGPPGAGKGTQSALLIEKLKMSHISTGDILRKAIKQGTKLGNEAKSYMDNGKLVPDHVVIGLIDELFGDITPKNYIFDGFPRTTPQAMALDELMPKKGTAIGKAVFLDVSRDLLIARLSGRRVCNDCGATYHIENHPPKVKGVCDKCGRSNIVQRSDDKEEAIKTRLNEYDRGTAPLKDYYVKQNKYVSVDGAGSTEQVFERIKSYLV